MTEASTASTTRPDDRNGRVAAFLRLRLSPGDAHPFWFRMALGLGVIASLSFLVRAFWTSPSIQDDARMFLSWMGRWDDPTLLAGDLLADYWSSVSPWFFRGLYYAAWWIGIEPQLFVKILPALLFPLAPYFAFRFLRAIGAAPFVAFVATAAVMNELVRKDAIISGTPRALWPIMLLAILDGLARRKVLQTAVAQLILTGTYPQLALVTATVIGLSFLTPGASRWFDLSKRRFAIVGAAAVVTIAGLLPFVTASGGFGPTATLAEARSIPTFAAGGRGQVFERDGSLDYLCSGRVGIISGFCDDPTDPQVIPVILLLLAGPVLLFRRALRPAEAVGGVRSALPLWFLLAALLWYAIAASVLFRLHLPNRYTSALLILAYLTLLPLAVERLLGAGPTAAVLAPGRARTRLFAAVGVVLALAVVGSAVVRSTFKTPRYPELMDAIRALPKDMMVAGFTLDLDFSPVFTGRPTLFNRELAVAYQMGYFRPLNARIDGMRDVVLTLDDAVLADRLERHGVGRFLITDEELKTPGVPKEFRGFFGPELAGMEAAARSGGPTALARHAPACEAARTEDMLVLDAPCLVRAARAGLPNG